MALTRAYRVKKIQKTYEESADAMLLFLSASGKGLLNIHAMRRASEQFSNKDYLKPSYYDRWLKAMVALCFESSFFFGTGMAGEATTDGKAQ